MFFDILSSLINFKIVQPVLYIVFIMNKDSNQTYGLDSVNDGNDYILLS